MREVRLHLHWTAGRERTQFDLLFAGRRFQENQLGAARRFVSSDFLQAEDVLVKFYSALEVIDAIARMQKFRGCAHALTLTVEAKRGKAEKAGEQSTLIRCSSRREEAPYEMI